MMNSLSILTNNLEPKTRDGKTIKVCHFTSAHQAEDTRIFKKECVSLAKAGYEVYLVQRGKTYEKDGVKIKGFEVLNSSRLARIFDLAQKAYKIAASIDADIYHFHDPELLPYGYELKKKGKIVIFDSHENTAESIKEKKGIPQPFRWMIYKFYSIYETYVCKKLDGVIYVTPNLRKVFEKLNKNIELITNYPILKDSFRSNLPIDKRLFYAGNMSDQWSQKQILEALNKFTDVTYVICGRMSDTYKNILMKNESWNKVDYKGLVSHKEVHELMKTCTVGMALLQYSDNTDWKIGTLGNTKIFEQMMAGLPIICTDFVLWKDFVEKYNCGICVDPNNLTEIKEALHYLFDNPNECLAMGINARQAVEKEFNWATQEMKLLSFYRMLLNR